jgi:hypothetical protein
VTNIPGDTVLLDVGDGPESILIYTSTYEAMRDHGNDIPGLYLEVSLNGCSVNLGPFQVPSIRQAVEKALGAHNG